MKWNLVFLFDLFLIRKRETKQSILYIFKEYCSCSQKSINEIAQHGK